MPIDSLIQADIRPFGKWQLLTLIFLMLPAELPISMIPQLANLAPKHVCSGPWFDTWSFNDVFNFSSTVAQLRSDFNATTPPDWSCQRLDLSSMAHVLSSNRSLDEKISLAAARNLSLESCPGPWLFDSASAPYRRSLIEDFQLVCEHEVLIPNSMLSYGVGMSFGQLTGGQLSDRFGRLTVAKFGFLLFSIEMVAISFCTSIWAFFFMRAVIACTLNAAYIASVTLFVEMTNDKYRNTLSFLNSLEYDFISAPFLVLLNFLIQDWRFVHVAAGLSMLLFSLSHFLLIQESPRWLVARGRYKEALGVVRRAIIINTGRKQKAAEVTVEDLKTLTNAETQSRKGCGMVFTDWMDLFSSPGNMRRLLPLTWIWISLVLTYFGVLFFAVRLDGNPYLIAAVMLWIGAPSSVLRFVLVAKFGRKVPLFIMLTAAGVFLTIALVGILVPATPGLLVIVMATLGMGCVSAALVFVYMYSPELFSTVQRSKALGFCSCASRLGMIAGGFIERLDELVWRPLPLMICAAMIVLAAGATLLLPSDGDRTLGDAKGEEGEEDVGVEMRGHLARSESC